jgi:hypothetical protein
MATVQVPKIPAHAPGQGVAELLKRGPLFVKADAVGFGSDTTVNLFELPGDIIIKKVYVDVTEVYEASGASAAAIAEITVPGDTGAIIVWTTDSDGTEIHTVTSDIWLGSSNAGPISVPSSGGVVTFDQTPGTSTTGAINVYMEYIPNLSKL